MEYAKFGVARNFIPCYRKSDMKPGMYDTVTGTFYTNQGSGEFILGPSITNCYTSEPNARSGTQQGFYTNLSGIYDSSKGWVADFNKSTALLTTDSPSTNVRSVAFWIKPTSLTSGGQDIVFVDYKSRLGFGKLSDGAWCCSSAVSCPCFPASISSGNWYHIVIVNTGSSNTATNRVLYINGVAQTANSSTTNWSSPGDRLDIGKRSSTSDGFNGQISNFMLFDTALTAAQVKELYGK